MFSDFIFCEQILSRGQQRVFYERCSSFRHSELFCKKCVLKNFAKFTRKHLWQRLFLNKVAGTGFFPVNFVKFLRTRLFYRTPPMATPVAFVDFALLFARWLLALSRFSYALSSEMESTAKLF